MTEKFKDKLEVIAQAITESVGTPLSIILHTLAFVGIMSLGFFGVDWNTVLLILTTLLSVEAIYLELLNLFVNNRLAEDKEES